MLKERNSTNCRPLAITFKISYKSVRNCPKSSHVHRQPAQRLLQTCGRCQQSSLELTGWSRGVVESWSRGVVESWSRGVVESCRSLGLLGLRDGYLSGPFSFLVL